MKTEFEPTFFAGERVVCINVETGKDNKFAGKMQGPYAQFMPCETKDTLIAVPHLSRQLHVLKLSGDVSCLLLARHFGVVKQKNI